MLSAVFRFHLPAHPVLRDLLASFSGICSILPYASSFLGPFKGSSFFDFQSF